MFCSSEFILTLFLNYKVDPIKDFAKQNLLFIYSLHHHNYNTTITGGGKGNMCMRVKISSFGFLVFFGGFLFF